MSWIRDHLLVFLPKNVTLGPERVNSIDEICITDGAKG